MNIYFKISKKIDVYYWDGNTCPGNERTIPQWLIDAINDKKVIYSSDGYGVIHDEWTETLYKRGYIYIDEDGYIGTMSPEYFRDHCVVDY